MPDTKPTPDYLESVSIRRDEPGRVSVLGHFETRGEVVLARLGEGIDDFRIEETLLASADAVAEVLEAGHLRGWIQGIGRDGSVAVLAIDYNENDCNVATSYKGIDLIEKGKNGVRFFTGAPDVDWKAARAAARRDFANVLQSSSINHFCNHVSGFRFDEGGNLVVDPYGKRRSPAF